MNVLVSDEFERQARSASSNIYPFIQEVVRSLEAISVENLGSDARIHRVSGESENLYVFRRADLRFFFTVRGNDVILISVTKYKRPQINVSRAQTLKFAANGKPVSGTVVAAEKTFGPWASITVETDAHIPDNAQLTIPDVPETGGCGLAHPINRNGRWQIVLNIGYSYIDLATIGN
jgi:mRNA-degrading endonuclease RelE of RelBE toxin-antitoxin system